MNVFELMATLTLNTEEFSRGLDGAQSEAEQAGSGIGGALSTAAGVAGRALLAAGAAAATGVATLTGAAVSSYGQYQQLVGGAELMFGEASNTVMENAANAYATMALSQNEYLEQANRFATGLTNDLGGDAQAAADLVDRIMQSEADIVAATGADMEMVQNAFNGIMRNNYVMLDNLGLGIDPTKEGMQEVIDTVNAYNEAQGNATNYTIESLADQEAALVDYIAMQGLSGYSAMEAGDTITGSVGQVRAAWMNLVTGLADPNADIGDLISRMVEAGRGAITNLAPIISQALEGIGQLIDEVAPIIEAELPTLINDLLPPILRAAVSLVTALASSLPSILSALVSVIPMLLNTLIPAILEMLPQLIEVTIELVVGLANALAEAAPTLIPAVVTCVLTIVEKLTDPDTLLLLINAALQLASGIAQGILQSLPAIMQTIPVIIQNLTTGFLSMVPQLIATAISIVGDIVQSLMGAIYESGGAMIEAGISVANDFIEDVMRVINGIRSQFEEIWSFITEGFAGMNIQLPHINLPHFTINGSLSLDPPSIPSISVEWYAKAYNQPRLLTGASIFGANGSTLLGGGEKGGELVVGWDELRRELGVGNQPVQHIHVYVGGTEVDDFVVDSNQRNDFISGGRG